ncbi:uncharacterized protein [Malus domestica]|uniref:uncharacterized protein n=1 Tax=Malus domestica TaxID=3750 RepID=UPI0010AB316C|nr:uncharacterized protein LOC103406075 [Malus domestica]XP_028963838.1 uncharacterized protein LOC103406075 [Malus domestica]XP_028963864.1 uncharacterized protein LOC103406075 [Malus domestica]
MEELRKLEDVQRMLTFLQSRGLLTTSSHDDSSSFLAKLILFLEQPCGELDLGKKCSLVSEYMPRISAAFLEEASKCITGEGHGENCENALQFDCGHKLESSSLHTDFEEMAMVGLDAMQRANSTLEDFCRSYFMFHGMDINKPQSIFQYLPMLSFTESYIYQLDALNEKTLHAASSELTISERGTEAEGQWLIARCASAFKGAPFRPLSCALECHGLLTKRMQDEFKSGEEYWALERKLCYALMNKMEIVVEDVVKAIHLKSFDYRVLNLLLYQIRGEEVDELHMEFLSISEFLVEVADDLFDYEEDVIENSFNILRMFVKMYGASAPTVLAKYIVEAEEKYNNLLKRLDPQLSLNYQRRCVEATKEGGSASAHPLGAWSIPPLILDEEFYRSSLLDQR